MVQLTVFEDGGLQHTANSVLGPLLHSDALVARLVGRRGPSQVAFDEAKETSRHSFMVAMPGAPQELRRHK